ncbi:MAG: N-acetylneuraminate synthase [Euryarchaeota archaeon]|nr:N-acetylneuraminate synthase [Euryarchaeota archaeon]|tara:strand:+ start:8734 stop:9576 length:843 start_codon:yes stop_codon:yes gene_type:complete
MGVFIIAEIGINHNGNINLAKKMIDSSLDAGADAVKFQKRDVETVYSKEILDSPRESPWGKTQREQKFGLEFDKNDYQIIDEYCKEKKIQWFASAWDLKSLLFLSNYKLKYNKIASAMIVDEKFLRAVAKQKKYTFISTGMSTYDHIDKAVKIFKDNNCEFELMQCVSAYPFDDSLANLNLIKEMKKRYNCKVGYSGHEKGGLAISVAAVALGATSIERHITLDRTLYGSDQAASLTQEGFKNLVKAIRKVEKAVNGSNTKEILDIEKDVAKKLRLHIKY